MNSEVEKVLEEQKRMGKVCSELADWADAEGTEWGEYYHALLNVYERRDNVDNPEFLRLLKEEIEEGLRYAEDRWEIYEESITHTYKSIRDKETGEEL